MRFKIPVAISNLQADEDLVRYTSQVFDMIQTLFAGNIGFVDNCKTALVSVTFARANTQQAVTHALGAIPKGYFQVGSTVAGSIFSGNGGANSSYIYLQASVAGTYNVLIF